MTSGLWLPLLQRSRASSSHQACPTSQVHTHKCMLTRRQVDKLPPFRSGARHRLDRRLYRDLEAKSLHNTCETWNFTHLSLCHTHGLITLSQTHLQSRMFVGIQTVDTHIQARHTHVGARSSAPASSFLHSFLPSIPPGARLTPRTTGPLCFVCSNPCLFLAHEHSHGSAQRGRDEERG